MKMRGQAAPRPDGMISMERAQRNMLWRKAVLDPPGPPANANSCVGCMYMLYLSYYVAAIGASSRYKQPWSGHGHVHGQSTATSKGPRTGPRRVETKAVPRLGGGGEARRRGGFERGPSQRARPREVHV